MSSSQSLPHESDREQDGEPYYRQTAPDDYTSVYEEEWPSEDDIREARLTYECYHCDSEYVIEDGFNEHYCSEDCLYRRKAAGILTTIYHDHRYCANCMKKFKVVYPPARDAGSSEIIADTYYDENGRKVVDVDDDFAEFKHDIPDCAIGRAYPLPHCEHGEGDSFRRIQYRDGNFDILPDPENPSVKALCSCGVGNHKTIERPLKKEDAMEFAKNLSDSAQQLLYEEKIDYKHDRDVLLDRVRERTEDPDIRYQEQETFIIALADAIRQAPIPGSD